jgi:hypothetical protein
MFSGIGQAEVGQGGIYFLPGQYLVEVIKVIAKQSRKGAMLYIIECEVIESNNAERPPGCKPAQIISMAYDAAFRNIKEFIAACNGISPTRERERANNAVDEEAATYSVDESNPLGGTRLYLTCTEITTRSGNPFTLHQWEPYEQKPPQREVQWKEQLPSNQPPPRQPPAQQYAQQPPAQQYARQPPAQQYAQQPPAQQYAQQPPAQQYAQQPINPYEDVPF